MLLLFTSYIAGVLTILAPCVLPILPIIIGGSVQNKSKKPAIVLISSLSISIVLFTLLLKGTTFFIRIPNSTWSAISGLILIVFGLITVFPHAWERSSGRLNTVTRSALQTASQRQGWTREIFMGLALGPVFASCSPTYSLIIATVLPVSFIQGTFYTIIYALGLATVLLLIALLGRRLTVHLRSVADPNGWFKKGLGIVFIVIGICMFFRWDKALEAYIIEQGYFGITSFEERLVEQIRQ